MKPSQTAQALRHIASKIENSKNPDKSLVAKDIQKVLAALDRSTESTATEIQFGDITGICIGFKPTKSQLDQLEPIIGSATLRELQLVSDDMSNDGEVFLDFSTDPGGNAIIVSNSFHGSEDKPLMGPDTEIWRTSSEFDAYINDWLHG
jgi:hypothetical protein